MDTATWPRSAKYMPMERMVLKPPLGPRTAWAMVLAMFKSEVPKITFTATNPVKAELTMVAPAVLCKAAGPISGARLW